MPAELRLAPVGSGKTEQALARITQVIDNRPFARVWVLLPTERQINAFRSRLITEHEAGGVVFNVEFFTFYDLYKRILDAAGVPTRELSEPARLRLLRVLAAQMHAAGELPVYGEIADKAGFVRVLVNFIDELKQARIEPGQFDALARAVFPARQKDRELHALYAAYQSRLTQHDIVDRDGEGWLAQSVLENNPTIISSVDLLIVDGYDQFTPVQAVLVGLLSQRVGETIITLTAVPGREQTVGQRFVQAQVVLESAFAQVGEPLAAVTQQGQIEQRRADLQHLADQIFQHEAALVPTEGGLAFLSAPDAAAESAAVLRRVKHLLLSGETRPDDVLIVLRDYERYRVHLQQIGRAYGLPLALHLGEPLAEVPPIRALMDLLLLHDDTQLVTAFPRRPLLDALQNPYFAVDGLDAYAVNQLEHISREFTVTGGRDTWLEAIYRASRSRRSGDEDNPQDLPPLYSMYTCQTLAGALNTFFEQVTPPPSASVSDYVAWIEGLIGDDAVTDPEDETPEPAGGVLNLVQRVRHGQNPRIVSRDLAALQAFKGVLRGLLASSLLLATLEDTGETVTWAAFLADLRAALARAALDTRPVRSGRVLVTTATDARGLPHAHVFIMGLSEGIFPQRVPEDPLYLDDERVRLREAGLNVRPRAEQAADDGLFYELISLARESLTLSRPTVKDGAPWVESHLWRGAAAVFADGAALVRAGEVRPGAVVPLDAAATADETALAVSAMFAGDDGTGAVGAYNWLLRAHPALWRHVLNGYRVEAERGSWAPHNRYTGLIDDPALLAVLGEKLGPRHVWSVSQLNDYGICPFRFFAGRVLHLEAFEEPQVGGDARQLGTLNHDILERTYRTLAERGVEITEDNLGTALAVLDEAAAVVLKDAPERLGFRPSPVWEQEKAVLMRRLHNLVRYDFTEMNAVIADKDLPDGPRYAYQQEVPFGIGGAGMLLELGEGRPPVNVFGYIDRIDRVGDDVIVLDYKTGTTKIPLDELEAGRNFQIMFYLVAAQGILNASQDASAPKQVRGGFYFHIRKPATSGELALPEHQDLMDTGRRYLAQHIHRAQHGDFTVSPSAMSKQGRCAAYCDFYRLCRASVTNTKKSIPS